MYNINMTEHAVHFCRLSFSHKGQLGNIDYHKPSPYASEYPSQWNLDDGDS